MHVPVLLQPAIRALNDGLKTNAPAIILDATFGNGGYTSLLLENPNVIVLALDRDAEAIDRAYELRRKLNVQNRLFPMHGTFSQIPSLLKQCFPDRSGPFLNGAVFDIGVSSNQLDDPKRGFSFKIDGPLDMRMHQSDDNISAETIVNNFSEAELANIITEYGQDRKARKIARSIVTARQKNVISSTVQLAEIVKESVVGKNGSWLVGQRHPAVRTFQALRIYINQEMRELEAGLRAAELYLVPQGRLVTVTFHSLEDRIVKKFLLPTPDGLKDRDWRSKAKWKNALEGDLEDMKELEEYDEEVFRTFDYSHMVGNVNSESSSTFKVIGRKVIKPTVDEVLQNPRARSAKLRIAERTSISATLE